MPIDRHGIRVVQLVEVPLDLREQQARLVGVKGEYPNKKAFAVVDSSHLLSLSRHGELALWETPTLKPVYMVKVRHVAFEHTHPRLCSPWWLAIINEPKPTIVVSESTTTATAVDWDML